MMRLVLIICMVAFICSPAFSVNLEKMPDNGILRGEFTQDRQLPGFTSPLHSSGRFTVTDDGILWQTEKPFASSLTMTQKGIVQDVNGEETLSLSSAQLPFFARMHHIIQGVMSGQWEMLDEAFLVEKTENDKYWQVRLLPRQSDDADIPITSMTIKGKKFVDDVIMERTDKSLDILHFFNQSMSVNDLTDIEKSAFSHKAP